MPQQGAALSDCTAEFHSNCRLQTSTNARVLTSVRNTRVEFEICSDHLNNGVDALVNVPWSTIGFLLSSSSTFGSVLCNLLRQRARVALMSPHWADWHCLNNTELVQGSRDGSLYRLSSGRYGWMLLSDAGCIIKSGQIAPKCLVSYAKNIATIVST